MADLEENIGARKIAEVLGSGGEEALTLFMDIADDAYQKSGYKGLHDWVEAGFWVLPKASQVEVVTSLIIMLLKRDQ